jgi:hypothetical protein
MRALLALGQVYKNATAAQLSTQLITICNLEPLIVIKFVLMVSMQSTLQMLAGHVTLIVPLASIFQLIAQLALTSTQLQLSIGLIMCVLVLVPTDTGKIQQYRVIINVLYAILIVFNVSDP